MLGGEINASLKINIDKCIWKKELTTEIEP